MATVGKDPENVEGRAACNTEQIGGGVSNGSEREPAQD